MVVDGVEGGDLVAALDLEGIEASTGSACTTGSVDPSHVLLAMGISETQAHGSLRLTLGPGTTRGGHRAHDRDRRGLRGPSAHLGPRRGGDGRVTRIVAAMSGGVDSSVAAALLAREAGEDEVIGVWMRTHGDLPEGYELSRSCCSPDAADDARRVAQLLGIPFYILNVEREFGARVIDTFVDAYLDGATPNPCQACNQYIKFDELLRRGLAAYGADAVATGHYARLEHRDGRWRLMRAADANKDQTYFLWVLDQHQLARTRFPLGEMTKPAVRALAADLTLPTAHKPESQEICFVPLGDYRELLEERRGYAGEPGPIIDADGTQVGTHTGYAHYTVGQRHGLGVALGEAVYVREVRPSSNTVVIGRRQEVAQRTFSVDGGRFVAGEPPSRAFRRIGSDPSSGAGRAGRDHHGRPRPVRRRDGGAGLGPGARPGCRAVRRRGVPRRGPHRASTGLTAAGVPLAAMGAAPRAREPARLRCHPRPMGEDRAGAARRIGGRRDPRGRCRGCHRDRRPAHR